MRGASMQLQWRTNGDQRKNEEPGRSGPPWRTWSTLPIRPEPQQSRTGVHHGHALPAEIRGCVDQGGRRGGWVPRDEVQKGGVGPSEGGRGLSPPASSGLSMGTTPTGQHGSRGGRGWGKQ